MEGFKKFYRNAVGDPTNRLLSVVLEYERAY
jgi:hypothetical protein